MSQFCRWEISEREIGGSERENISPSAETKLRPRVFELAPILHCVEGSSEVLCWPRPELLLKDRWGSCMILLQSLRGSIAASTLALTSQLHLPQKLEVCAEAGSVER